MYFSNLCHPTFKQLASLPVSVLSHFSHVWLFADLWTVACQTSLSMECSRQEYQSGLPFPPPGDLPDPGIETESLVSPALAGGFLITGATRESPSFACSTAKNESLFSSPNPLVSCLCITSLLGGHSELLKTQLWSPSLLSCLFSSPRTKTKLSQPGYKSGPNHFPSLLLHSLFLSDALQLYWPCHFSSTQGLGIYCSLSGRISPPPHRRLIPLWFAVVQLPSCVRLFGTSWTAAHQAFLSSIISQSLLKFTSIESVMPSNHLILCHPFFSSPQSFPASGSFPMCRLFTSGGQNVGASASALV